MTLVDTESYAQIQLSDKAVIQKSAQGFFMCLKKASNISI